MTFGAGKDGQQGRADQEEDVPARWFCHLHIRLTLG